MSETLWIALIGALLGGGGLGAILKVADKWWPTSLEKLDDEAQFRKELREEVTALRNELKDARALFDKERGLRLIAEQTVAQLQITIGDLKRANRVLTEKVNKIERRMPDSTGD